MLESIHVNPFNRTSMELKPDARADLEADQNSF